MQETHCENALLVGIQWKSRPSRTAGGAGHAEATAEESLLELRLLAGGAGALVAESVLQARDRADAATLVGSGKLEEIKRLAAFHSTELVIFDQELTPTQQRNLENALDCRVVDRTQLILDIFAHRARTREGRLQVELAQLNYLLPRLAGRGVEMSRLGGGIGTRGPGETQLETDRRRIHRRIRKLERDLETVKRSRGIQRRNRESVPLATIGLVGYTNAGKSSLFNRLTGADVFSDARMFATLDPTVRQARLPSGRKVLLSDTVGFIRNLPTTLVKAFRATLEEVLSAEILLHVVDVSSSHAPVQTGHVFKVLDEIGARDKSQILVLNKTDLLGDGEPLEIARMRILGGQNSASAFPNVAVSARTGAGLDTLLERIDESLQADSVTRAVFRFPHEESAKVSMIHELGRVVETRYLTNGCEVEADVPESLRRKFSSFEVGPDR